MIHTSSFLSMQELRLVFTHTCTHTHTHTHTHTNIRTVHTSSLLSLQELRLISKETPGKPGERSLKIFVDFVDIPSAHAAINLPLVRKCWGKLREECQFQNSSTPLLVK